ncbi:MAG: DNA-directed RNA polymerase subunit P [Candidatus Helarchaeota archaeon]
MYKCAQCKKELTLSELQKLPSLKCLYCGYKILYKIRPPVVKKIKAR